MTAVLEPTAAQHRSSLAPGRDMLRRFVGGRATDAVVVAASTSEAIDAVIADAPGDVVILDLGQGHASGERAISAGISIEETLLLVDEELASAPAALLVVPGASAVTGEVLPIGRFASAAHRRGARILVDAEALVSHRSLAIASWGIDYVAFAGAVVGRADWLDGIAVEESDLAAQPVSDNDFEAIGYRQHALRRRLDEAIAALPAITEVAIFNDATDRVGAAALTAKGQSAEDLVERLGARGIVGVSAHALPGYPDGLVRVGAGAATTADDIDRLVDALVAELER